MNKWAFFFLSWSVAAIACKDSSDMSEPERKKVIGDVTDMLYQYNANIKDKGLQSEFEYIDNSPGFFWVPPGATGPQPLDTIISSISHNATRLKLVNNTFDTLVVIPLTIRLAQYSARIHSIVTDTGGHQTTTTLVETGLVVKRKNGWKLLSGQTSVCNPIQ